MNYWLNDVERDLIETALTRMKWDLSEEHARMLNGGQLAAARFTRRRIDELLTKFQTKGKIKQTDPQ